MILAGDIGGTKTTVGLFRSGGERPEAVRKATYPSADWPGLPAILADFLAEEQDPPRAVALGVAGPVTGDRVQLPNLAWDVDTREVSAATGTDRVLLLNDLAATAEGVPALRDSEIRTLAEGEPDGSGNAALIAAGTGLGMCIVARPGGVWTPLAGEGGHQTFAAQDEEEEALRRFLAGRYGHVSVERVVSGPGLAAVYDYVVKVAGIPPAPAVAERMRDEDHAAVIGSAALAGECEACARALRIFVSAYGAAAGNLALVSLARAGVWIGGGIAPKILPALADGAFLDAFRGKGRFEGLLARIPVRVILNPETALLGAARRGSA